jgi:hypothetical protein
MRKYSLSSENQDADYRPGEERDGVELEAELPRG